MIKYNLICPDAHEFEAWFSSSADYEDQQKARQISCPSCGSAHIQKAIMAPFVATARAQTARREKVTKAAASLKQAAGELANEIRKNIEKNCDYVGEKFSDEARAIHYGEKEARNIYGEASPAQAKALQDEGLAIAPLPAAIDPQRKKKLN